MTTPLAILSSLAGPDFDAALDRCVAWGIKSVDLHDGIYGKAVLDLTAAEARRAAEALAQRNLQVYCLSTPLFSEAVEAGEQVFRERHAGRVGEALRLAEVLKPKRIGLHAAATQRRREVPDAIDYLQTHRPWLMPLYREALAVIRGAGFAAGIANHGRNCVLATPAEVLGFFAAVDPGQTSFIFDPVELWQMGSLPTLEACRQMAPLIGCYRVKGGLADRRSGSLCWRSGLADASWPVVPITSAVLTDASCEAICLRGPTGHRKLGYDYHDLTGRDVQFLHAQYPQLAQA